MGYYSFYKILKDIIKTIFGKRTFRILLIVLIVIFISVKVFAVSEYLTNCILLENNQTEISFTLPNYGTRTLKIPSFIYDYKNIFIGYQIASDGRTRVGAIYFSNDNIYFSTQRNSPYNAGTIYGDIGGTYYSKQLDFYFDVDISNKALSYFYKSNLSTSDQLYSSFDSPSSRQYVAVYGTLYDYNTKEVLIDANPVKFPEVATPMEDLQTLNFDVISINAWDYSQKNIDVLFYDLNYGTDTVDNLYPTTVITLNQETTYFQKDLSADPTKNAIYWIPNTETGLNFIKGGKYGIRIGERNYNTGSGEGSGNGSFGDGSGGGFRGDDYTYNYLGDILSFTISDTVSDEVLASLNMSTKEKTEEKQHDETLNAINNQTQATQDLNNSITDGNVDTDINLPQDNTEDITQNGINNIFDNIYNAFTSENAQDIVFPIPFTNKNITLSPNYLMNVLQNNNATWLITFIQAFWWYIISRFIIKDISRKINKIKSGNIENIENNNIKEEML